MKTRHDIHTVLPYPRTRLPMADGGRMGLRKHMHAYRNWRNQLIVFDEVDVNTLFEVDVDGKKIIRPHILRGVNKKTLREIHQEIRAFQFQTIPSN